MNEEQEKALLKHLENLTHQLVHVRDLGHEDKVGLLDSLCDVKRAFGVAQEMPDKT